MKDIKEFLVKIELIPNRVLVGIIFLFGFITYGNSLFNGFVWDDLGQVIGNPNVQSLSNIFNFFGGSTFYSGGAVNLGGIYYRPILSLIFAVNYSVWQQNAFGFHFFSVILHAVNVCLIFFLFKRLFSLEKYRNGNLVGLLLSLVFLVHPANTEAVAYISAVQEPLYAFFLLAALFLVIKWMNGKKSYSGSLIAISLMVLLSLLSKESGVLAVPVILIFVFLFARKRFWPAAVALASSVFFYLTLRLGIAKMGFSSVASAPPIDHASLGQRLLTLSYEVASYFRLIFFPKDLFISQQFVIKSASDPRFLISLPVVLLLASILLIFAFELKSKLYIFFLVWTVFSFSMILNIFPLDFSFAERWLYMPFIGILGMTGVLILRIQQRYEKFQIVLLLILVFLLPVLIVRTIIRNANWKDNETLISHDIKFNPDSYELQGDYGTLIGNSGDIYGAQVHTEKALELSPTWWAMYTNLGKIYQKEGNIAKAKEAYIAAIKNINDPGAYDNLAVLEYKTDTVGNTLNFVSAGLKFYPQDPTLNFVAAFSYYKLGDKTDALNYAEKTYSLHPSTQTYSVVQRINANQNADDLLK